VESPSAIGGETAATPARRTIQSQLAEIVGSRRFAIADFSSPGHLGASLPGFVSHAAKNQLLLIGSCRRSNVESCDSARRVSEVRGGMKFFVSERNREHIFLRMR
jgi:hypothetical protein